MTSLGQDLPHPNHFTTEVLLDVYVDDNATVVHASLEPAVGDSDELFASGSSKRAPGDKKNTELAVLLATSRALRDLQHKVSHQARKLEKELYSSEDPKSLYSDCLCNLSVDKETLDLIREALQSLHR